MLLSRTCTGRVGSCHAVSWCVRLCWSAGVRLRCLSSCLEKRVVYLDRDVISNTQSRSYAGKKKGAAKQQPKSDSPGTGSQPAKANMDVCVGANIYKNGEDPVLKEDSAYPDWLWTLLDSSKTPLEDILPDTKQYWRRVNKHNAHERNTLKKQSAT